MKKFAFSLMLGTGLLFAAAFGTQAQVPTWDTLINSDAASFTITDDTGAALLIKYIGTGGGTITVASATITLKTGFVGTSVADTTVECPLSAPYGGVLDTSNAACDSMGELVDVINSTSGSMWRAVIVDALRSDPTTTTQLNAVGEQTASVVQGVKLATDTSVALFADRCIGCSYDIRDYLDGNNNLRANPHQGFRSVLFRISELATYTGAGALRVIDVQKSLASPNRGAEAVTQVLNVVTPGATTVWGAVDYSPAFGIFGSKGGALHARLQAATTFGTVQFLGYGLKYRVQ